MRAKRPKPTGARIGQRMALAALTAADKRAYFGPLFFMQNLRGLVRERCPVPADGIPSVHVHLMDGEDLDVCHILGIAPGWIALAVHEREAPEGSARLRTELVPYPLIARVSIGTTQHEGSHPIGFNAATEPEMYSTVASIKGMTPEEALRAVAGVPVTSEVPASTGRRRSVPPSGRVRRSR
jgi:hypothetical protein